MAALAEERVLVRERPLLNIFMTTTAWSIFLILHTLHEQKTPTHGLKIAHIIQERTNGLLEIPNSSLYPALNRMKDDEGGFVRAYWEKREDEGKRHRKFYVLTEAGEARYQRMRLEMRDRLLQYKRFTETCLTQCGNRFSKKPGEDYKLNIQTLLRFWLLYVLQTEDYGLSIKRSMRQHFPNWDISDGTFYPLLSEMTMNGWLHSRWGNEEDEVQRRTVRYYQTTNKGLKLMRSYGTTYLEAVEQANERASAGYAYIYE